jgi:hypothetical protein
LPSPSSAMSLGLLLTGAEPDSLSGGVPTGVCPGVPEIGVRCSGDGRPSWAVKMRWPAAVVRERRRWWWSSKSIEWSGIAGDEARGSEMAWANGEWLGARRKKGVKAAWSGWRREENVGGAIGPLN